MTKVTKCCAQKKNNEVLEHKRRKEVVNIGARSISFVKGKGSLNHNNREFIYDNVHEDRVEWDRTYKRETLKVAYDCCFEQVLEEYNANQKRKDRMKTDYIHEIEHSGNKEKVFYENVVQIGKMEDTPVVDENGNLSEAAKESIGVLDEYARTFQKRNPNLYVFNSVLHLDEATPHLHIDYIPVAHGYKNGLQTRNSLTKALQEMGFEKATGKRNNETIAWQRREREHIQKLCEERGIEIELVGVERDNYSLPEYKEACRATESVENHLAALEQKEKKKKAFVERFDLKEETLKVIEQSVKEEAMHIKGVAVPVKNFLGDEEYVKVKKTDWKEILKSYKWSVQTQKQLKEYEDCIAQKDKHISKLETMIDRCKNFIINHGLVEIFNEFLLGFNPSRKESIAKELDQKKKLSKDLQEKKLEKPLKKQKKRTEIEM